MVTRWSLVVAMLLLSGCVSADPPLKGTETAAAPTPQPMPALPCAADATSGLSKSLQVLATETFDKDPVERAELDVQVVAGRTLMAVGRAASGGIDMLDVTDARHPLWLSSFDPEETDIQRDVKFTPDGTGLVLGGDETLRILDIRNVTQPAVEHEYKLEAGAAHMVAVWEVKGATYVSISKAEGADIAIFGLTGDAGHRSLARLAHPATTPLGDAPREQAEPLRAHDTWFEVDPDGTPLLWVANVWWGVVVFDVSDPAHPVQKARILPSDPLLGYVHQAQVAHLDGRRLVVGGQEYGTGVLKVWDATDLANPKYIAYSNSDVITTAFHNLQVVGRYVYATHFDEGLFVFDLGALGTPAAPVEMPVFAHAPPEGRRTDTRVPVGLLQSYFGTRDVALQDGILWTSEATFGIRSLAFGCTAGDATATSTG
ncbi:MAG TPA: hypothetical protein VM286_02150 [Candidatus Thermoplasmatota archaeon]|nr:hypothetical protein [Candidatus Thermoplasmatota archaeon]